MPWRSTSLISTPALGGSSRAASRPVSRPASRPPSPSLNATHLSSSHGVSSPLALDPLADYFSLTGASSSRGGLVDSPGSFAGNSSMGNASSLLCTSSTAMAPSISSTSAPVSPPAAPAATPSNPLEIFLDSDNLILRGQGGDMAPVILSGYVSLYLSESTNIKEISLVLTGKAKVHFQDATNHSYTHNLLDNHWTFLEAATGGRRHAHTLKAGLHNFPFTYTLDGSLPSSINTPTGDGKVEYKLRASVVRAGLGGLSSLGALGFNNLHSTRTFSLSRMFTPEALEFNQTLEIENTWPGKIMYSITLPYKAYAAGDSIPVILKFMPIAKGVRVLSVTSSVKEYTMVYTKGSTHQENRGSITTKHEIHGGHTVLVDQEVTRPPPHWSGPREGDWTAVAGSAPVPTPPRGSAENVAEGSSRTTPDGEEITGDDEVCTSLTIPLPPWTTPSHSLKPVQVSHKIKWSCAIANPDGHVSELRCALPITILDYRLLAEARVSGAPARNLMMGTTIDEAVPVDLPSYSNHVYDRVAVAEAAGSSGFSLRTSPDFTPPHSRPGSRPGSPRMGRSSNEDVVPPRRQLTDHEAAMLRNLSMGGSSSSGHITPPHDSHHSVRGSIMGSTSASRAGSRAASRANSRAGSRAGSRASSPDRHHRDDDDHHHAPERTEQRRTLSHLLHLPQSLKPLASISKAPTILRNNSMPVSAPGSGSSSPVLSASPRGSGQLSFSNLPAAALGIGERERSSSVTFAPSLPSSLRNRSGTATSSVRTGATAASGGAREDGYMSDDNVNALSRVPSYSDNLGAFVVPLDPALPTYIDSQEMERARSTDGRDTPGAGAEAGASPEVRAERHSAHSGLSVEVM